jgi:hypothetical protein
MFNLSEEHNIPTFYATCLLLLCAALLGCVAAARRGQPYQRHWAALALVFVLVAIDEGVMLHERLVPPLQRLLGASGPLFFAWVIPYGLGLAILGCIYLRFLRQLPARWRRRVLLAAGLYVGGALGIEMVGAAYFGAAKQIDLLYALVSTLEETLEIAGLLVFVHVLFGYVAEELGGLCLCVGRPHERV